jgi:putative addiction module component (TIGR02574 family)
MGTNDINELLKLDASQRLEIAEQLWESVCVESEAAIASPAEIAFIDRRLNEYLKNPTDVVPWAQVRKELGL